MAKALYMGFDLSTQQLKGIVVQSNLKLVYETKVDFDADLAHYGIKNGVLANPSEGEIFAPTSMWLEAVDIVLSRLKDQGLDFSKVNGISGAGMQHGTVFWNSNAESIMANLDPHNTLLEQLQFGEGRGAFSHAFSPNWQDASTQKQCEEFNNVLGSKEKLAELTGSSAHHRFSGPQIMRFREKYPEAYSKTARISLVSSFLASVFLGKIAPMDIGDVCGANLWDIPSGKWHPELLALAAGGSQDVGKLESQLGPVAKDGGASLGHISSYFTSRYGFPPTCEIIPFTGDNPSTILALPLRASDAIVSLGTSTTFLMSTPHYKPDPSYHFMNHPTTPGLYMFMLCYKNGGLAREHVRDALNSNNNAPTKDWSAFNDAALSTLPLSQRSASEPMRMGLFFPRPEIVPNVRAGTWRFLWDGAGETLSATEAGSGAWPTPHTDARAILESQFLSLRLRSRGLVRPQQRVELAGALLPPQPRRVYLVGGGSLNEAIAEVCGDVLGGAEGVFRLDIGGNACALGAAYKAVWGVERPAGESFEDFIGARWDESSFVRKVGQGYKEGVWEKYGIALKGFEEMEKKVVELAAEGL